MTTTEQHFHKIITHDCKPTLNDREVIKFCRQGYYELEAVVSRDVCDRVLEFFRPHEPGGDLEKMGDASELMDEDWFVNGLVLQPDVAGAVRSLLGANFTLPPIMSNHAGPCPEPKPLNWHIDGGNMHTYALNYLQVFCLTQDTTPDMGPTEIVPGSHFLLTQSSMVDRYGAIRGARKCVGPAGTVIITCYPIWHRRTRATSTGWRHLLKYQYYRTTAPQRDWIIEDDFDPAIHATDFSMLAQGEKSYRRNFLDAYDAAHMFTWLCGAGSEFKYLGGVAWPGPMGANRDGHYERWGVPPFLRNEKQVGYEPEAPNMTGWR